MNRRRIATAALQLVGREGLEALTMKRLAEEVDRRPASLYNHIAGRQDLIEAMRGILAEQIKADQFRSSEWREALEAWARDYLRVFSEHPNVIALMATTAISDPATLATYEQVVAGLVRGGWRRGEAVAVMRAVESFVLGSVLDIVAPETLLNRSSLPPGLTELYANLDPQDGGSWSAEAAFELGLRSLLDGLTAGLEGSGTQGFRMRSAAPLD